MRTEVARLREFPYLRKPDRNLCRPDRNPGLLFAGPAARRLSYVRRLVFRHVLMRIDRASRLRCFALFAGQGRLAAGRRQSDSAGPGRKMRAGTSGRGAGSRSGVEKIGNMIHGKTFRMFGFFLMAGMAGVDVYIDHSQTI